MHELPAALRDRYQIERTLDQNDYGSLFLARDLRARRSVEILAITRQAPAADQFADQVARLAAVRHPALPAVLAHATDDSGSFLVAEHIPGQTLEELRAAQERQRLPAQAVVALLLPVLDALGQLHAAGLAHRDIRPSSIRLAADGRVVLTSPALAAGDQGRDALGADLHALGATLFTLLSGSPPPAQTRLPGADDPLARLDAGQPGVPAPVAAVVRRLLQPKPRERYADLKALRADLLAAMPSAAAPGAAQAARRQIGTQRTGAPAAWVLVALVVAASLLTGLLISVSAGAGFSAAQAAAHQTVTLIAATAMPAPSATAQPSATAAASPSAAAPAPSVTAAATPAPTSTPRPTQAATSTPPPSPSPSPAAALEVIAGTLTPRDFERVEVQFQPYQGSYAGESFERGTLTHNIWLGGEAASADSFLAAELADSALKLTLQPGQEPGQRWLFDTREVGRRKGSYLVQLDVALATADPDVSAGIAFDVQDERNAVLFEIFPDQTWQLRTIRDGAAVPELSTPRTHSDQIQPQPGRASLWVVRLPDQVQLWLGGQHIATVASGPFNGGYTGVVVSAHARLSGAASVAVDNFRVRAP